ncbi:MAG TPA: hypothetical protein VHY35_10495 [Stellaceae bacterium]|jgi:hypothetical protein|nr:hypothetical protein [Stellaceae bacterium]
MAETSKTESLPPVTDERSAAAHIEGLLDLSGHVVPQTDDASDDEYEDTSFTPDNADDAEDEVEDDAQDESSASADEETDEVGDEPEEKPAIVEPPKSWSAEDAAKFKELPLDLQHVVARREGERDKAINQRMQQLADERKAVEAHVQKASEVQTQYAQTLNQLITLTIPEIQQVENVNWVKLASDDPAEYVRLSAVRDGLRQRVGFMQQQMQQVEAQQNAHQQQQMQARLANQYDQLVEYVPEFKDQSKAVALVKDIGSTMSNLGFSHEEVNGVTDARIVRAMARLAQLEKLEAARVSAKGKKTGAPAPRLMTPNAAPVREDSRNKVINDQYKQLRRSGSTRDAARLLENIL